MQAVSLLTVCAGVGGWEDIVAPKNTHNRTGCNFTGRNNVTMYHLGNKALPAKIVLMKFSSLELSAPILKSKNSLKG